MAGAGLARAPACSWRVATTLRGAQLTSVTSGSGAETWVAGTRGNEPLVERWDGRRWSRLPPAWPNVAPTVALAASSAGVWVAATIPAHGGAPETRTIARWDGGSWRVFQRPPLALPESEYTALAADGAQGLWAFGTMSGPGLDLKVPFAERWDGSRWHLKSIREPALSLTDEQRYLGVYRYAFITAAVAVSPNDAWGVGFEGDGSLADDQIHAWHWDGSRWHLVPIQGECGGAGEDMTGIAAVSPHDLWATGYAVSDECTIYGKEGGFVERRQRDSWHVVENRGPAVRFLSGISATSSSDVWAVGDVIEHWDGRRWRIVPSPNIGPDETLAAVAAVSPADAWAVGGGSIERFSCR